MTADNRGDLNEFVLLTWAEFAVEHRTGLARLAAGTPTGDPVAWVVGTLRSTWRTITSPGILPAAEALPWMPVLVAVPDIPAYAALSTLLTSASPKRDRWVRLGEIGPLAYAAGLNVYEALDRATLGTLTEDGLRLLAGLRGWRLPESGDAA